MTTTTWHVRDSIPILSLTVAFSATAILVFKFLKSSSQKSHNKDDAKDLTAHDDKEGEPLHSILHHFVSLQLDPETTVEEANKRRTTTYYLKAREAHDRKIVRGVQSYTRLLELRHQHVERTFRYRNIGTHSHRTVVVMCDASTSALLDEARKMILAPLKFSHDLRTRGVWIPKFDMLPPRDMHVTVAIPWWWHTMREGNYQLSQELASRFRQTLFLKFHHPFQVELQRIVLLGGQTLVALWRCVGERVTEDGHVVYDRHGECVDPFVRLRVEIVRCFTTESEDKRLKPLTYQDVIQQKLEKENVTANTLQTTLSPVASTQHRPKLARENSIELKTPGLGQGDGFIHTTLCRLPLDCLSQNNISLEHLHRLCREATATMSGHRMVISKFRLLETTGCGGLSNPCIEPIFDETIEAPSRFKLKRDGRVNEISNLHVLPQEASTSNRTIGSIRKHISHRPLAGLFDDPSQETNSDEIMSRNSVELVVDHIASDPVLQITAPVLI